MRFGLVIPFIFLFFSTAVKAEQCLSVQGLQFEKIGYSTLLIIREGKNWGTMEVSGEVPAGKLEFRFFTPTICDETQNDKFHLNGKLTSIRYNGLKAFK